jgi:superfamily II DNA helicase RecQ
VILDMDEKFDGTEVSTFIFSCIQSINQRFGIIYICAVLAGSKLKKIEKYGHSSIPSFGALNQYSQDQIKDFIWQLIKQGYLYQTRQDYPVIKLLDKANFAPLGMDQIMLQKPDPNLAKKVRISLQESVEKTISLYKEGKSAGEITELLRA